MKEYASRSRIMIVDDEKSSSVPSRKIVCSFNGLLRLTLFFAGVVGLLGGFSRAEVVPARYTVDALSFTPPAGWKTTQKGGSGRVTMSDEDPAKKIFCEITVYNSLPSRGELATDFFSEWAAIIGQPLPKDVSDQDNRIIGTASDVPVSDEKDYVRLITYSAGTKIASIVVLTPSANAFEAYRPKIEAFLASVSINSSAGGRSRIDLAREQAEMKEKGHADAGSKKARANSEAERTQPPVLQSSKDNAKPAAENEGKPLADAGRKNVDSAPQVERLYAGVLESATPNQQAQKEQNEQVHVRPLATIGKPTPPPGWTIEETNAGWILRPGDFGPAHAALVIISKQEKAIGTLQEYLDSAWAANGLPRSAPVDDIRTKSDGWDIIQRKGAFPMNQKTMYIVVSALQNADRQFTVGFIADSVHSLQTIAAPGAEAVDSIIAAPSAVRGKEQFTFGAIFPAGWVRQDGPGHQGARRVDRFGQMDRMLTLFADEPVKASLQETFEAIWDREVARLGAHLDNPGLMSPERPQPLKRRLKNGLAVWFEGGVGRIGQVRHCYLQVYMVPAEKTVSVVTMVYAVGMEETSSADRAPVWTFLESLQPSRAIPEQPLFTPADCVGSWRMTVTKSNAYGGVDSGGMDDLDLKSDGTYSRTFAGNFSSTTSSWEQKGTWKLDDTVLTLTPKWSSDQKHENQLKRRLYSRAVFNGKTNLIVGPSDDSRLPTDALETGAMVEVATHGGALLRYKAREE